MIKNIKEEGTYIGVPVREMLKNSVSTQIQGGFSNGLIIICSSLTLLRSLEDGSIGG